MLLLVGTAGQCLRAEWGTHQHGDSVLLLVGTAGQVPLALPACFGVGRVHPGRACMPVVRLQLRCLSGVAALCQTWDSVLQWSKPGRAASTPACGQVSQSVREAEAPVGCL